MLIFENPDAEFVIVSDDQGFDAVVSMWSKKQISVKRYYIFGEKQNIVIKPKKMTSTETIATLKKKQSKVKLEISLLLMNETEEIIDKTTDLFIKYYFYNKEIFCHSLKSIYGKKKGETLNKIINKNIRQIMDNTLYIS